MRISLLLAVLALPLALSSTAGAGEFSGRIDGGFLVLNKADNLWGDGSRQITSITAKPESHSRIFPVALFNLGYRPDGARTEYFVGTPLPEEGGDTVGLAAGLRRELDQGSISASLFTSFGGEEWENPYVTDRTSTDAADFGVRLRYADILGSGFSLAYNGSYHWLDNDRSGDLNADLKRAGTIHRVTGSYRYPLTNTVSLTPSLSYVRSAVRGASNRYHAGNAGVALRYRTGDFTLTTRVGGTYAAFDALHPVYGETRDETGYDFSSIAVLSRPFGFEGYSLSFGVFRNRTFTNIDFFEQSSTIGFAAVGYSF